MGDRKRVVRPYGDTTGDGMVQVSFTLPVAHGPQADGAAQQLANKMGIDPRWWCTRIRSVRGSRSSWCTGR
jgi:beta-lysine 5,6-aminomutase beta subunit